MNERLIHLAVADRLLRVAVKEIEAAGDIENALIALQLLENLRVESRDMEAACR